MTSGSAGTDAQRLVRNDKRTRYSVQSAVSTLGFSTTADFFISTAPLFSSVRRLGQKAPPFLRRFLVCARVEQRPHDRFPHVDFIAIELCVRYAKFGNGIG